jgi:glycerol-3-phosphate dehydrogenase (NAD+)
MRRSVNKAPIYWGQAMLPSITAPIMAAVVDTRMRASLSLLATADKSSTAQLKDWWALAQLSTDMGGLDIGGHAPSCGAYYSSMVLACWSELARTCPILGNISLADGGLPMLDECLEHYQAIRDQRDDIDKIFTEYGTHIYHTIRGGKLEGWYKPRGLPKATSLPTIADMMNPTSKSHPPAQRQLTKVGQLGQWLSAYESAKQADQLRPHPKYKNRQQAHFIAISQPGAAGWLDMVPDGTFTTKIESPAFEVMLQRQGGLDIALADASFDTLEAAGTVVDRRGDGLQSGGEYNRRHNAVLRAIVDMVSACAVGQLLQGDKGDPEKTADLNSTHAVDLAELGANEATGGDVLYEVKCASPTKATQSDGNGSKEGGGAVASVGHRFGFGNTEEEYRTLILGCQEQGRKHQGQLDHATGRGWVKYRKGQYDDALVRTRAQVVPMIVETTGALAPHSRRHCGFLHGRAKRRGAIDRTRYGRTHISTRSFFAHHTQQISKAATMWDARAIIKRIRAVAQATELAHRGVGTYADRSRSSRAGGLNRHGGCDPPPYLNWLEWA